MTHTNGMASTGNLIRRALRHLPDTWAALILVGAILLAGMGVGVFWAQQKGLPGRVNELEVRQVRADSIRQTDEAREVLSGRLEHRVDTLEVRFARIEQKVDRIEDDVTGGPEDFSCTKIPVKDSCYIDIDDWRMTVT